MELDKCLVIPQGARKRTIKQLEKSYQEALTRTLSPEYAHIECWLVCDNHMTPEYCGKATVENSDNFDFVTFAKNVAAECSDLVAKQAIVTFNHKIYTMVTKNRHHPLMGAYHWEFRREVVKL
jgi:N-formylglutamate amidohydrolase